MSSKQVPSYKLGDVIFKSEPWIYTVLQSSASEVCYRCLKKPNEGAEKVRRCTQCSFAHYCSPECQKSDWITRHKAECKILQQALLDRKQLGDASLMFDYLLVILKMISKLKKNEVEDVEESYPTTNRNFHSLMSHEEELSQNPGLLLMYSTWKPYIAALDKKGTICPNFQTFVSIYGRFQTNAFSISDYFAGDIAKGLYLGPSIFDHSCDYNAVQTFVGKTMIVKAIRDIAKSSDVRIAYDTTFSIRQIRQANLQKQYFFTCTCRFCGDKELSDTQSHLVPTTPPDDPILFPTFPANFPIEAERYALKCISRTCQEVVPFNIEKPICSKCGVDNAKQLQSAKTLLSDIIRSHEDAPDDVGKRLHRLEKFAEEAGRIFHPTNMALGVICLELHRLLSDQGKADQAILYLRTALPSLEKHANKYESAATGALSDLMLHAMSYRKFEEAYEYAQDLMDRLKIIPGEETPVYFEYSRLRDDCELATWARRK